MLTAHVFLKLLTMVVIETTEYNKNNMFSLINFYSETLFFRLFLLNRFHKGYVVMETVCTFGRIKFQRVHGKYYFACSRHS